MTWKKRYMIGFTVTVLVTIGCFSTNEVTFTLDNPSAQDAATSRCLQELDPHSKSTWRRGCSAEEKEAIPVIITVKDGAQPIYEGSASCREWKDTERTFTIEQRGQELSVTDSLPELAPTP
jgi:hypothetical protein